MKLRSLTVDEACGILVALGCGSDPIQHRSRETDADEILNAPTDASPDGRRPAWSVHVTYYTERTGANKRGTLQSMVADRLRKP